MPDVDIDEGRETDVDAVLEVARALESWFTARGVEQVGIDVRFSPFVVARSEGRVAGFVVYYVAEATGHITWLGVHPDAHRRGIGRALIDYVANSLAAAGVTALRTDTLGDSVDYAPYAKTRAFYRSVGFVEHARVVQDDPEWPERLTLTLDLQSR